MKQICVSKHCNIKRTMIEEENFKFYLTFELFSAEFQRVSTFF